MNATRPRADYRATFAVLLVSVIAYTLLQSMVLPVLPTIQRGLHTSEDTVTWALTAYLLSSSVFTPIFGRVGDMMGKKRMLVVAMVALTVGSVAAALSNSIGELIVARVIQGIGGGVLPLTFGIVRDEFPPDRVQGAVGIVAALTAVGAGVGVIIGGPIVDALNFHWLFWIPAIIAVAATVLTFFLVPESEHTTPGRVNWTAAVVLSAWLVALLVAVSEGPTWGWYSGRTLGLFVVAAVFVALWVAVEWRSPVPLIDMKMMRLPVVWTTNLAAFLFGVGMFASYAFVPEFVQTPRSAGYGFGASVTKSGLFLFPLTVTMFVCGMISGRLSRRLSSKVVLVGGSAVTAVSLLGLALTHSQQWEIFTATAILGAGFGLAYSAMSNLIVEAVPPEQTGVASGMNANIRNIGGSIGAAVMATVVTSGVRANALPKESGYTQGFLALTVAVVFATVASMLVPSRRSGQVAAGAQLAPLRRAGVVSAGAVPAADLD